MSDMSPIVRDRIEAQGFLGLDDQMIKQVNYWLRLSPAICMIWAAIGTALQSATVLWALVPFALLGAVLPGHPFDLFYTHGARYVTGGPRLPRYPIPRRFACLLATLMIVGAAWSFQSGLEPIRSDPRLDISGRRVCECQHGLLYSIIHLWSDLSKADIV